MTHDSLDPDGDPFKPPAISTLVHCIHCDEEYDSFRIEWRVEPDADGKPHGFWCCPMPGCDGMGFGFDIFPVDPEYRYEHGELMWCNDEDEQDDDEDDEYEVEAEFGEEDWIPKNGSSSDKHRGSSDDEIPF